MHLRYSYLQDHWLSGVTWPRSLLSARPTRWDKSAAEIDVEMEYDEDQQQYRQRSVFKYSDAPTQRLRKARERLDRALARVESMERYVTSRRYDLNREFSKL